MKRSVLLVSHYTETQGMVDKFAEYFTKKQYTVTIIKHPLFSNSTLPSLIKQQQKEKTFYIPSTLQFFLEGLVSIVMYKKIGSYDRFDLAITFDPLCFLDIYLFKKLYNTKKIVFYNLDYSKNRFANPVLNAIYQNISTFAYRKCDYFFSVTKKFIADIDPKGEYQKKNFLLKHPVDTTAVHITKKRKSNALVYAGSLGYSVNFSPLLEALVAIKKKQIPFSLDVYGEGDNKQQLIQEVKKHDLQDNVVFKGSIDNKTLVNHILPTYMVGLCPYIRKEDNVLLDHMFHGNDLTSKLVEYLSAGLPIISTRLYEAFEAIETNNIGFLANTKLAWEKAIITLLTKPDLYKTYQKNALRYAKQYDEEVLLDPLLQKILD